ncbi:hypothetical protein NQ314_002586 [Rhamnusium bicolor]|uniref:Three prime repair exonuclease 2 n=1 Tax=Rhamnusium bicolor TaxID=1586634 RepID=A0AAV8ZQ25_9CUCU|nr:hypothetical protein NQ314_002586 [Rhamnusium bicolor]
MFLYEGLSNHLLEHQSKFSADTVNIINCFLNHNPKPICFVAHNGDNFDYPILRREIENVESSLLNDIFCIDSLAAFRNLYCEETKSELAYQVNNASSVPVEFTDEFDGLLCDVVEEVENQMSQKLLDVKKLNETTPKKQIIEVSPSTSNPF